MFYNCIKLNEINVSNFDTNNVVNMSYMFYNIKLNNIDVSNFDTSNTKYFNYMFAYSYLKNIDISNFQFDELDDLNCMFYNCLYLTDVVFPETKHLLNYSNIFKCSPFVKINK
jgi:surface protein